MSWWDVIKDVLLTVAGVGVIVSQAASSHPSDVLLAAGLALTVPSVGSHVKALLGGGDGDTSHAGAPSSSSRSSQRQEGSGD